MIRKSDVIQKRAPVQLEAVYLEAFLYLYMFPILFNFSFF